MKIAQRNRVFPKILITPVIWARLFVQIGCCSLKKLGFWQQNPISHKRYEIKGETLERKNKSCPKCGEGFLLAAHKNRLTCGKCGYAEFISKKPVEKKKEEAKPEKKPEAPTEEKKK